MTIDGLPLATFGPLVGVVILVFLGLMKGWVVVRHVYDAQVSETAYWRDAFFKEQAAHTLAQTQNTELLEVGRLQRARIEAAEQPHKELS
ncbi:hypothetical protein [Mumia sp. DW29H23]|uniref:hypothetical protein n=1 Tax=Mumia sp. DW29H23 TaxID=3421241 RepID=UPI003D68202C